MSITIKNLSFSYPDKEIFKGFNFEFKNGVFYSLSAPSGKGKTTLFRLIAGLEKPDSGSITTDGKTSYMFQENRLFPSLSLKENLKLVCSDEKRIKTILERLDLTNEENSYPDELSGGMKRRVSLARTLLYGGDNFVFDEPFTGLDEETKSRAVDLIKEICHEKTIILVTHNDDEKTFCHEHITL